jgi:spermidine synthase
MMIIPNIKKWGPLTLISAMGLFLELAVIRWLGSEVRLFAYIKNIPLLAAFLGLAIGFGIAGKRYDYKKSFIVTLFLFTVVVLLVGRFSSPRLLIYPSTGDEFLWFTAPVSFWTSLAIFLSMVAIFFFLTMLIFIPLGQATGEEMDHHKPVPAYIVNIFASLIGIWIFSIVSFLQMPPAIWYLLFLLGILSYFAIRGRRSVLDFILAGTMVIGLFLLNDNTIWSPYNRLSLEDLELKKQGSDQGVIVGYTLNVQQVFYQTAIDLSPRFLEPLSVDFPDLADIAVSYNLPYTLVPQSSRVLIVGAGMGNDAAAAIRNNMGRIEAVEIDPTIVELGYKLHPEKPYDNQTVQTIIDDARSFFEKNQQTYDMIAFGLLDSHTLLSGYSSVRLDSYVYTLQSFDQVKKHLASNGIVSITFASGAPWIEERLGRMLVQTFGSDRVWVHHGQVYLTFIASNTSIVLLENNALKSWKPNPEYDWLPLPSDDWPYLYLRDRVIPGAYWQALLVIGIVAIIFISRFSPSSLKPDWHFWLLGAAFLLIEFISVTRLALLFGTTWLVNALAISGVLIMILGANLVVLRVPRVSIRLSYFLLFVSLVLIYFFPFGVFNQLTPILRGITSTGLLSLPLFFSGLIFAESLCRTGSAAGPLASNLSGSVFGGVLEYGSVWWGMQSLYVVAMIIYGLAFFVTSRRK